MSAQARWLSAALLLAACGEPSVGDHGDNSAAGGAAASAGMASATGGTAGVTGAGGGYGGTAGIGGAGASGALGGSGATAAGNAGTFAGVGGSATSGGGGAGALSGTSGAAGSPGGSAGLGGTGGAFTLVFRDDFDTLDLARWQLMTHSWEGNLALFAASAASVQGGQLNIRLTQAPSGTVDPGGASKSFFGAEVRSRETLTYGRVRARARLARGSAVVSALVTIYTPWPADDWNEFDIECLGKDPANVQFNAMVYTGPEVMPPATTSVTPTQFPQLVGLGFDPSADFHVYTIEWTPAGARFLVDEQVRHTWTTRIDLMGLPQNTLLTIWASSSVDWAGAVSSATGQAVATYDWVELYRYAP